MTSTTTPIELTPLRAELVVLVTAIWFDIDHGDGSGVSAFFTPDAELRFSSRSFHGTAAIDAVYRQRARRGPRVSRHLVTSLHVITADPTAATAVSTLLLFGEDGDPPRATAVPAMVGDVIDHFERRDRRWLIRSRHIRPLFVQAGTTLAVPFR